MPTVQAEACIHPLGETRVLVEAEALPSRKQIVEPVFGQIKQARGFRQFLLRGLDKVRAEWALICTAHNLLKLAKPA